MDRAVIAAAVIGLVAAMVTARRLRRPHVLEQIDPDDFGLPASGRAVTGFTAPYCLPCQDWTAALAELGLEPSFVDVSARPDLARRYRIAAAPWIALVDLPSGRVLRDWRESPSAADLQHVREALGG